MEKALKRIQIISWETIILGAFLVVKIPETIISFLFETNSAIDFINNPESRNTLISFSAMQITIIIIAIFLMIGGALLLKKRKWGRKILETIFWVLLVVNSANLLRYAWNSLFGAIGLLTKETLILTLILSIPYILIIIIMIANLIMIRNSNLKKLMT